jgi:hypothetical protein
MQRWASFLKEGGSLLYRDPVVPAERVQAFSQDELYNERTIDGIDVLVRR